MNIVKHSNRWFTHASLATMLALGSVSAMAEHASEAVVFSDFAKVVNTRPLFEMVEKRVPQEHCYKEQVRVDRHRGYHRRADSHTPALLGSLIGGAIGNGLGTNKSSKKVGAVVGAILGGSIANDIRHQSHHPHTRHRAPRYETVERCETTYSYQQEQVLTGYEVTYRYRGQRYVTQTDTRPGNRLPINVTITPAS